MSAFRVSLDPLHLLSGEELLDCSLFSCTIRLKSSESTAWLSCHIQGGALASAVREMEEAVLGGRVSEDFTTGLQFPDLPREKSTS